MDFEALTDDGERDLDFFSNKDVNDIEVDGDFLNFFKTFQQDGGEIEEIHPNEREKSKDENGFFWERKMNEHASIHGENKSKNIPEKEKLTGALQPSKPLFFKSSDDAEGWITKTSREKRNSSAELQKIQEQSKKFPKKDQSRQNVQDKSEKDNEFIAPRNKPTRHRLTDLRNGDFLQREKQHESQVETSKTEDTFTHDFEEQKEEHRKMETVYIDNIMPEIQHPHADGERDGGMLKEGELLVDDSRLMKDTDIELKYDSEPVWKEIDDSLSMISSLTDELQATIQSKILEAIENFKRNLNDGLDSLARNCEEAINEHLVQSKSNTDSRARISELTEIVESLKCRPSLGNLRN